MDEILEEFYLEAIAIIGELYEILATIESAPANYKELENFGQKVDRIMGAAKSLELNQIGSISEFCKTISYKAAQSKNIDLSIVAVAFLFEAIEVMQEILENIKKNNQEDINPLTIKSTITRLDFMNKKLAHIQRSSVAIDDKDFLDITENFNQLSKSK